MVLTNDLIRFGVYTQLEGCFDIYSGHYRFRFGSNQIHGIPDLIKVVASKTPYKENAGVLGFNSKEVYEKLLSLGFNKFKSNNWNVPNGIQNWYEGSKKEYLRAIIDCIGNVGVLGNNVVYIESQSVNTESIEKINKLFGGKLLITDNGHRNYLRWRGKSAFFLLNWLDWKFYNYRNSRGVQLIKLLRWEDFL